jgi:SHS family sialic acid transporter-like MFS transporter
VGYTFPVMRYLQRVRVADIAQVEETRVAPIIRRMLLAACLSGVALLGTWGGTQQAPAWADKLTDGNKAMHAKEHTLTWLSIGAIVGTLAAALLGDWLGRRKAYFLLCLASFGSVYLLFQTNTEFNTMFLFCAFVAGTCTASFYGWLPLYLPELFRTNIRATGQGFGFNFGRILAAVGSFQLGALVKYFSAGMDLGPIHLAGGYPAACTILSFVYVIGMILIWFAPETKGQPLPE